MFPVLFEVPSVGPISSFGVMMAAGAFCAWWLTAKRLREVGSDPELASRLLLWCVVGGVLGAKLYFAVDTVLLRQASDDFLTALFARGGMTWYGGLIGGAILGAIGCRVNGLAVQAFANAVAPGLALGQSLGRVGCFLQGDDYGVPSDLPWAITFPLGAPPTEVPVHPTQLYEAVWLLLVAWLLWRRRDRSPFLVGEYMAANGLGRVVIEVWRTNPEGLLGLTQPQWVGLGLVSLGLISWFRSREGGFSLGQ